MNILYISFLTGNKWAGPTYSVPKQIEAQNKLDNVYWVNFGKISNNNLKRFFDKEIENDKKFIQKLPNPFNHPDLIVIEQFYGILKYNIANEIMRLNIPYIIIPRGELTFAAQKKSHFIKIIVNFLIFRKFAKKALCIEYLTEKEKNDSGETWNNNYIVIPNGIVQQDIAQKEFNKSSIKCVSIGRIDPYHKGLDILLESCELVKNQLIENNCFFDIYGPDVCGKSSEIRKLIKEKSLEDVVDIHDAVFGEEKIKILLNSDVFVITSRFEGQPMALLEALSLGVPCIATRGSNMKKEIDISQSGWTCETEINDLARCILKMIDERDLFIQKSKNAKYLSQEYGWDEIAKRSHEIYLKMLDLEI